MSGVMYERPLHDLADRRQELRRRRPLEHIRGGARSKRLRREVGVLVHRQEHQLHVPRPLLDLTSGLEAVQQRHRDVEDDDVGLELLGGGDEGPSVGDLTDDVALGRQQLLERAEQQRVIVGQQHTRSTHTRHSIKSDRIRADRFASVRSVHTTLP